MKLERKNEIDKTPTAISTKGSTLMITPPIDEDYWLYRVHLFKDQYILGFPKFTTIGIGFAQEDDWNTNLPYSCATNDIVNHIWHNHKYEEISKEQVHEAIKLIQDAIIADKQSKLN